MDTTIKCYYVKQMALYSLRFLNGYKCDMEELQSNINNAKRFLWIEENIVDCALSGSIINDLNKYKNSLTTNYSSTCRGC